MQHCVAKLCLLLALTGLTITEWVEIAHSQPKTKPEEHSNRRTYQSEGFTTPSDVWIEYQRERFGTSNRKSNPLVVSHVAGLNNSAQIVVPAKVQVINARTRLSVQNSTKPPVVKVDVVTPKVETTSRRHSSYTPDVDYAESESTATEQPASEEEQDIQLPSMQGFLKFLKSMQSAWIKKSALSIENKIKLLKQLRDNLMKIIEQQFSVLWEPTERRRRKRRGLLDDSDFEFPPEAAIMSINFLTFAVFLIKLVLRVVQVVKSKHYNFSGFNINTEVVRNP